MARPAEEPLVAERVVWAAWAAATVAVATVGARAESRAVARAAAATVAARAAVVKEAAATAVATVEARAGAATAGGPKPPRRQSIKRSRMTCQGGGIGVSTRRDGAR